MKTKKNKYYILCTKSTAKAVVVIDKDGDVFRGYFPDVESATMFMKLEEKDGVDVNYKIEKI